MKKYLCRECQEFFFEKDEASVHASEVHEMEFEDCISVVESLTAPIEETPKETPTDKGISEERLKELHQRKIDNTIGEMYLEDELDETEKGMVLSHWLARTEDKSEDQPASNKLFKEVRTTANAEKLQYQDTVARLKDPENVACPCCNVSWDKLARDENLENLSKEELNKVLIGSKDWSKGMIASPEQIKKSVSIPILRIIHIKSKHPSIWRFIRDLYKIPVKKPNVLDPITSNPESCSDLEKLSTDQIAEKLSENPEARKALLREWHLRLQKKKEK